ncbi:MAG: HlyD family efflux transporter periplasmic adaptor subunit [Phycisphaerales bacterium]|nr:HlyD family efflux transporter periplasmic adaptor subunit [Phycisphaerales bacterium]
MPIPNVAKGRSWSIRLWVGLPVALLLLVGLAWVARSYLRSSGTIDTGTYYSVEPMTLDVRVTKDGELQSINNIDVSCQVEGQTAITFVVKEGSTVKKGDVILILDSSQIKQKLEDSTLDLQRAEADLTASKEQRGIQELTNAANLEAAHVELTLAQLDLQEYTEGIYPQLLSEAQRNKEMAETTLQNRQEDLNQTRSLFAKGFVTAADVKKSELDLLTAQNDLEKKSTAVTVLAQYTHEKDLTSKKNALAQAEQKLARVKRENASNLSQKIADEQARDESVTLRRRRVEHMQEQVANCTIKAPADGMVVYSSSFDRSQQTPIQEGTSVRERQLLLRLPDTASMKAVVRVPEAQVSKLHLGQPAIVKIVGIPDPVSAKLTKISVLADNSQRWWNPDLKEYPVDLALDYTPANLKPGLGAQVEILVDSLSDVLAVPLACIYSVGKDNYVFVRHDGHPRPRKVDVGTSNQTHVQIVSGLSAGDQVLLLQMGQGRQLLESAGIKLGPTTSPTDTLRARRKTSPSNTETAKISSLSL